MINIYMVTQDEIKKKLLEDELRRVFNPILTVLNQKKGGIYRPRGYSKKEAEIEYVAFLRGQKEYKNPVKPRKGYNISKKRASRWFNAEEKYPGKLTLSQIKKDPRYISFQKPKRKTSGDKLKPWRDFLKKNEKLRKEKESYANFVKRMAPMYSVSKIEKPTQQKTIKFGPEKVVTVGPISIKKKDKIEPTKEIKTKPVIEIKKDKKTKITINGMKITSADLLYGWDLYNQHVSKVREFLETPFGKKAVDNGKFDMSQYKAYIASHPFQSYLEQTNKNINDESIMSSFKKWVDIEPDKVQKFLTITEEQIRRKKIEDEILEEMKEEAEEKRQQLKEHLDEMSDEEDEEGLDKISKKGKKEKKEKKGKKGKKTVKFNTQIKKKQQKMK